jgi:hypothetical protein
MIKIQIDDVSIIMGRDNLDKKRRLLSHEMAASAATAFTRKRMRAEIMRQRCDIAIMDPSAFEIERFVDNCRTRKHTEKIKEQDEFRGRSRGGTDRFMQGRGHCSPICCHVFIMLY